MSLYNVQGIGFGAVNTEIDQNILRDIPEDCKILSTESHGTSFWAKSGRINVSLSNGRPESYFVKVVRGQEGKGVVQGEFESMKSIYGIVPEFVPKPIAWGTYQSAPDTHYFLSEFKEMREERPEEELFTTLLSSLHAGSVSPNGKFGFHIKTFAGNLPQFVEWQGSWEVFFSKSMRHALELEIARQGPDETLHTLAVALFENVIPRLLRPLESQGRNIKPSLIHGDLWNGNCRIDASTGKPVVFDACCFYAHHEYEFGQWMPVCNGFGPEYIEEYLKMVPKSDPVEDFEGRLALYRLRFDTHVSALFGTEDLRKQVIRVMGDLVERYGLVHV